MLKRILLLLLALMLALPAFADEPVWDVHAAQLAQVLPQLAGNETYIEIHGGIFMSRTYGDVLSSLAAQTWTRPLRDVYLSVDKDALRAMMAEEDASADMMELLAQTEEYVQSMLPGSLVIQALGDEGIMMMSALQNHIYFVDAEEPDGTAYFIRFYADGAPMFFQHSTQDGIGFLNCYPLTDAALAQCASAADVQAWLAMKDVPPLLIAHDEPQSFVLQAEYPAGHGMGLDSTAYGLVQSLPAHVNDPLWQNMLQQGPYLQEVVDAWMQAGDEAPVLMAYTQLDAQVQALNLWGLDAAMLLTEAERPVQRLLRSSLPMNVASSLILRKASDMAYLTAVNMSVGDICYYPDQPDGMGMYIFVYEDGRVACAVWYADNGIVDMSAMPLPIADIAECRSAAEIMLWFASQLMPMTFTEITLE